MPRQITYKMIFLILWSSLCFSQVLPLKNYSVNDGLPNPYVSSVVQDKMGFIWFGTNYGISKFDGTSFKNYSTDQGLISNHIYTLYLDSKGNIWIGTSAGVSKFDGHRFINYSLEKQLIDRRIRAIAEDKSGNIWLGSSGTGICKLTTENKFVTYKQINGNYNIRVNHIFPDSKGNLWFSTFDYGILKYQNGTFFHYGVKDGIISDFIWNTLEDKNGDLWFSSQSGIIKYHNGKFFNFQEIDHLKFPTLWTSTEDNKHNLWFGSNELGVFKYSSGKFTRFTTANGFADNSVLAVFEDREKNLWFCTAGEGVQMLPSDADRFTSYTRQSGLSGNNIYSIVEDLKKNIWFGSYGDGISKYDNGKFVTYTKQHGLPNNYIYKLYVDRKGNIWIGSRSGVSKFFNGKFTNYGVKEGLADKYVYSILEDHNGNMWFGTFRGLSKFSKGKFTNYSIKDGLSSNIIWDIFEDRKGNIWLATDGGGINKLSGNKIEVFSTQNGLASNSITSIYEDRKGDLWFGTDGGGLSRYSNGKFSNLITKNGLASNIVNFITQDDNNNYWIGTSNGINVYNGKDIIYFSCHDGLITNQMNQSAVLKDSQGNLWFGTAKGVTRFNKSFESSNHVSPLIHILGVEISGKEAPLQDQYKLKFFDNNIKIDFVALSFTSPSEVVYSYILEGIDHSWHFTKRNSIQYVSLPEGNYTFKLKATNNFGISSEKTIIIKLYIAPPFWKQWWFIACLVVILLTLVLLNYRAMKKRNILLEEKVEARTELLKKSRSLLITELQERLAAEEALQKSQFQLGLVWENSIDGMRITDKDGIVIKANNAYCKMMGKSKDEIEGKLFALIYKEIAIPETMNKYKERFQNREVEPHYEREFVLWNGENAWFEVSSSYLDLDGSNPSLLLIFRNVTERKNNETALKSYASELEVLNRKLADSESKLREMNKSKDKYFSIISHDLRSPFNALIGITDFLLNDLEHLSQLEVRNFVQSLHNSTKNVYHLLEDLLQWSRIQTGKIEFRPNIFKLNELLCYNISLLLGNSVKKNIDLINALKEEVLVYADEAMVGSVFQNLLSNAIKFTHPGGFIKISSRIINNFVEISVCDNGVGIEKTIQEKLFKIESNSSTLGTAKEKGTGLGLIICKEFVERNGGKLSLISEKNKGTTFHFTIPLSEN
ncbi:MAG: two-component regulator propeller domain-containing protein [Bacteroidota bacterium]|nr:two-component regulator propeller domain-containing protein [Bacteroidota bacterium]MDP4195806.1 two-component regulator propeller domain-containing protein [Bacteroidota bacterium]